MKEIIIKKNLEKIFIKNFKIKKQKLENLSMNNFYKWDSLSHIKLIFDIENKFNILINNNAKISLTSYKKLREYLIKTFT